MGLFHYPFLQAIHMFLSDGNWTNLPVVFFQPLRESALWLKPHAKLWITIISLASLRAKSAASSFAAFYRISTRSEILYRHVSI
jgi:hypothetical protein